jgi:hypothetical protein
MTDSTFSDSGSGKDKSIPSKSRHRVYTAKSDPTKNFPSEEEVKKVGRKTEEMVQRMQANSIFNQS